MALVTVLGPRDAGPGDRERMLEEARRVLGTDGSGAVVRVDVPARGTEGGEGKLRDAVHPVVPALQSGSLFGGSDRLLVVDVHQLLDAEAQVLANLVAEADLDVVTAVFVAAGSVPAPLAKVLRDRGEIVRVKALTERDASSWLAGAARERGLRLEPEAAAILVQRFGTDVGALGSALDQLAVDGARTVGVDAVRDRYRNRPDEPPWYLGDAIAAGREGEALRRLADFLEHGHPLQLLAYLEGEVRRMALAGAAPDLETYAGWVGGSPKAFPVRKMWERRGRARASDLRRALDAVARADLALKTAPEPVHRVTLERLVVALCRWMGRR